MTVESVSDALLPYDKPDSPTPLGFLAGEKRAELPGGAWTVRCFPYETAKVLKYRQTTLEMASGGGHGNAGRKRDGVRGKFLEAGGTGEGEVGA